MASVQIKMPDGSVRDFDSEVTGYDLAKSLSPRLAKEALAVKVDGEVRDISAPLPNGASVQILTFNDPQGREVFWHSSSHIMAQAVLELFPSAKLAIGPPIDEGWYYDFEVEKPFTPEDLENIEKKMAEIVKENATFKCKTKKRSDAIKDYQDRSAVYKVEILEGIEDDTVTFYTHSSFEDLCRGPHLAFLIQRKRCLRST